MLAWLPLLFFLCLIHFVMLLILFRSENLGGGGGCLSLFQVHFLGSHPFVLIPGAMFNPRWTFRNDHSIASDSFCSQNTVACLASLPVII